MFSSRGPVRSSFVAAAALSMAGLICAGSAVSAESSQQGPDPRQVARAFPSLQTRVAMPNLDHPWDVAVLPSGAWLVTERDRLRITLRRPDGHRIVLADHPGGFWASGETGLMSVVADPGVRNNSRFYTCTGFVAGGTPQVRVVAWRLSGDRRTANRIGPLVSGIQIEGGRHGGCRLRFGPRGGLYVGTGDSAVGTNPQDLRSLNGKVLRVNRFTGAAWPTNPWADAANPNQRLIYTYGHRNVQGLAYRDGDTMWSVEQGSYRDDEVNRLVSGGNYGWNPVPGYNESVPMTDFSLPGRQLGAKWSSGNPTLATSGATWVHGSQWGDYDGTLAVAALKDAQVVFMKFDGDGTLLWTRTPAALDGTHGRLRSIVQASPGTLLVTTDNGGAADAVVAVTPGP